MKIRIKFAKYGTMKFIGHLDLMRYFQKVFRRSGIDIAFTEGMSPHMILSFAAPLGIGAEGMSEYADIRVGQVLSTEESLERMNAVCVEGIEFLDFLEIPEGKEGKAMSLVSAADYAVRFRAGHVPENLFSEAAGWEHVWRTGWDSFLGQSRILVEKETKKEKKEVDIRPMIYKVSTDLPFPETLEAAQKDLCLRKASGADTSEPVFYFRLATGSAANLKPELVMEAFARQAGYRLDPLAVQTTRLELFAQGKEGQGADCFVPLSALGKHIPQETA